MTTRKLAVAATLGGLLGGCSTPGPLHLYSIAPAAETVHDIAASQSDAVSNTPSYLEAGDQLTGFAYDPFTDHFFLRLAPGNKIRVVDRPARKIKRELAIADLPENAGGDLAVSPRDGHLFLVDAQSAVVIETTRFGKLIRRIALAERRTPIAAIAFDAAQNELLVLGDDGVSVERYDRDGRHRSALTLARRVTTSLAFAADTQELFAPLAESAGRVGVFDARGQLVRTIDIPAADRFIDVGPHSFLRVF